MLTSQSKLPDLWAHLALKEREARHKYKLTINGKVIYFIHISYREK